MISVVPRPSLISPDVLPAEWHPFTKTIYASRITHPDTIEKHLRHLISPTYLPNVDVAAMRIARAIIQKEPIIIYGDYDVDGACSTALLFHVLHKNGAKVSYFIPNRKIHHYGLSIAGLTAIQSPMSLVITVDNGTCSHDAAKWLKERGIDLIITDHHEPDSVLPPAIAIVNPKLKSCDGVLADLAGVGVVFYLLIVLRRQFLDNGIPFQETLTHYLDIVALGSIADVVPLSYNNRILVHQGIRQIRLGKGNIGIHALCTIAGISPETLSSQDMSFVLAPRLNAAGRLGDMADGVALLLTDDWATAQEYALKLDAANRRRKAIENATTQQAISMVDLNQPIASAYHPDWHEGIIGIVAARLKSHFSRPSLVATQTISGDKIKASLRSIAGVNIYHLLHQAAQNFPDSVLTLGGHEMAAGFTVASAHYPMVITAINSEFEQTFGKDIPVAPLYVDGELPATLFTLEWARYLEILEPWGANFPVPTFVNSFIVLKYRQLGDQHNRLLLREINSSKEISATCFFQLKSLTYGQQIRIVYQLQINRFYGDERLELLVQAIIN